MFGFMSAAPAETTDTTPPLPVYQSVEEVDFRAFSDESIEILLKRDSGEDGVTTWQVVESTEEDAQIWRGAVEGSDWSPFRVKMTICADKHAIEGALLDTDVLLQLDDMTERMDVLHKVDAAGKLSLRHCASKAVFPIAAREFVIITTSVVRPDGRLVIASRSIDMANVEVFEAHVRARNMITGYIIDEKKDTNGAVYCEVTLLAHADLAGYIPATVVNMLGTSATVKVLANLKAYLEDSL